MTDPTGSLCAGSITTFSLYGPLFLSRLHYNQFQVNAISTGAELSQYLPIPLIGYLCDRYSPRPLSLAAAFFFGVGYLLAALTYRQGLPRDGGWSFRVMLVGFIGVGLGTSSMVASSITTCAKNFGKSKYKGVALALPIGAIGLSGLWLSQVGSRLFCERDAEGRRGDVDVYRFLLFLGGLLLAVGLLGGVALRVVDEEELIDEAVEELERSGFLEDSAFFHHSILNGSTADYGTLPSSNSSVHTQSARTDALKKTLVLNTETHRFLADPTMWFLAAGFFLVTGPAEAFLNNFGTVIFSLQPAFSPIPPSNSPATNISIVAISSTIARLLTGWLSDLFAPQPQPPSLQKDARFTLSRIVFLLASAILLALSQLLLASSLIQHHPALFPAVSALAGLGYGTTFSITPIIVSIVWGVQNFGTNWGIVAIVPAGGAAVWGALYSAVYQRGVAPGDGSEGMCYGYACYGATFSGMVVCSLIAVGLWGWVRRRCRRTGVVI